MLQPGQLYSHHLLYGDRPPGWAQPGGGPGLQSVRQLHGYISGEGTSQNVHHRHRSKWFVLQLLSLSVKVCWQLTYSIIVKNVSF